MRRIEIHTGYYANIRKYVAGGCVPVGISIGKPKYLMSMPLLSFRQSLAPSYALLRVADEAEYTRRFKSEILARLDYGTEIGAIEALCMKAGLSKAVLLCYEKPPSFCHRKLVADWISSYGEFRVTEYGYGPDAWKKPVQQAEQLDLFGGANG